MNRLCFLFIWLCLLLLVSCEKYVPDPIDPRLPKYSQTGKNTAGALVNGSTVWRSGESCGFFSNCFDNLTIFSYVNGIADSVQLSIWGTSENPAISGRIQFTLVGVRLEDMDDIQNLQGTYSINTSLHKAHFDGCQAKAGNLFIRHAGRGNNDANPVLAGTFSLYLEDSQCGIRSVEWGRFDFEVIGAIIEIM